MAEIDGTWFRNKLIDKRKSQRQLAKFLGVDPSAITLMLDGKRKMQLEEAEKIASFIGEPVNSVLRAAGLQMRDRKCKIIGYVNARGQIERENFGLTDVPSLLPDGVSAVRIRATGQWSDFNDGLLFFKT